MTASAPPTALTDPARAAEAPAARPPDTGVADDARALVDDLSRWLPPLVEPTRARLQRLRTESTTTAQARVCDTLLHLLDPWPEPVGHALRRRLAEAILSHGGAASAPAAARADANAPLSLLSEEAVDEEIAVARLVQAAEAGAERELLALASLCTTLRGGTAVSPEANPMRPSVVAAALRQAVADLGLPLPERVLLLRELGSEVGAALPEAYRRHLSRLRAWGLRDSRYVVRRTPGAAGAATASAVRAAAAPEHPMRAPATQAPSPGAYGAVSPAAGAHAAARAPGAAEASVAALVASGGLNADTCRLLERLAAPVQRLAAADPTGVMAPTHPLWLLLDRLARTGLVHDELPGANAESAAALEGAIRRLEAADPPRADDFAHAVEAMDVTVTGLLDAHAERVAPEAARLDDQQARQTLECGLRTDLLAQLRGSGAPPGLRQFLLGPWLQALVHTGQAEGCDSPKFMAQAALVDRLIDATTRADGRALPPAQARPLLTHARLGLEDAGLGAVRVQAELKDLTALLARPAPVADTGLGALDGTDEDDQDDGADPDAPPHGDVHAWLPTEPMAAPDAPAPQTAAEWCDDLRTGAFLCMFMLGRWLHAQLVWRSDNGAMFVFASRHGGRTHTLSRRSLQKLHDQGLARLMAPGEFVQVALLQAQADGSAPPPHPPAA